MYGFNNREIAIFIWGVICLIIFFWRVSSKENRIVFFKSLFEIKLLSTILLETIYIGVITYFLFCIEIWSLNHLNITIIWTIFIGFPQLFKSITNKNSNLYFKIYFKNNISILIIIEVLLNFKIFSFLIELILAPIMIFVSFIIGVASAKAEYEKVFNIGMKLLFVIGMTLILWGLIEIISDYSLFFTRSKLIDILLPVLYTFLLVPFLYFYILYSEYEELIVVSNHLNRHNPQLAKKIRKHIFIICKFSLMRVRNIRRFPYSSADKADNLRNYLLMYSQVEDEQKIKDLNFQLLSK